jgi:hypothetical protein
VNALGYLSGHWTRKHSGRSTMRAAAPLADPVRAGLQPVQRRLDRGQLFPRRVMQRGGALLPGQRELARSPTSDQIPQKLVVLKMHGERRRGHVLAVEVIPEVREKDLDRFAYRKAGDVLG